MIFFQKLIGSKTFLLKFWAWPIISNPWQRGPCKIFRWLNHPDFKSVFFKIVELATWNLPPEQHSWFGRNLLFLLELYHLCCLGDIFLWVITASLKNAFKELKQCIACLCPFKFNLNVFIIRGSTSISHCSFQKKEKNMSYCYCNKWQTLLQKQKMAQNIFTTTKVLQFYLYIHFLHARC